MLDNESEIEIGGQRIDKLYMGTGWKHGQNYEPNTMIVLLPLL